MENSETQVSGKIKITRPRAFYKADHEGDEPLEQETISGKLITNTHAAAALGRME